ncbi:proline dehydrogenase [Carbonactinospora thermoautotrophica]|uniref:proline dehydrogenase n=1 Tax=Carbonactinospora thermoautotrophica TaxID=1469144 RepID=A0A132MII6_9ACTN|nr:proline dehydrogenase family protein [Carbonactinospora thermoautotrophica]KWW97579.1 proline dehydrogenase [Carbonactinospora thermoautotrophica]KWW98928.1 Proline dehydrogenase [Carbonactinospora thermoautotrophica]KWX08806.1 proline dehydrogenase [Carbonactinospora thermoautotrophica]MCX9191503.1 proline dehydrogenase [Carbonactinospora thermoautotrophica]
MLRRVLLAASRSEKMKNAIETWPVSRSVVRRFVAGTSVDDAIRVTRLLTNDGLLVTLDHLGEDTLDRQQADATRDAYLVLLQRLAEAGLTEGAEVSLKLSAIGQALPGDGEKIACENAYKICEAARAAGTTVTLDMEDHTTTDSTLAILRELRRDFPWVGAVLQAYLKRTEADCRDLAYEGSRVRLCKGAYAEPASVAYQDEHEVDRSYVRCLKILMGGRGYPMVATHDPRLIEIAGALAVQFGRDQGTYEYQMLYGVRTEAQRRLAGAGERMRVYVPYGQQWYGYLMRRLAERPANLAFFLRSLASRR